MSRAEKIRKALQNAAYPMTVSEILQAIGEPAGNAKFISSFLVGAVKSGEVAVDGRQACSVSGRSVTHYRWMGKQAQQAPQTPPPVQPPTPPPPPPVQPRKPRQKRTPPPPPPRPFASLVWKNYCAPKDTSNLTHTAMAVYMELLKRGLYHHSLLSEMMATTKLSAHAIEVCLVEFKNLGIAMIAPNGLRFMLIGALPGQQPAIPTSPKSKSPKEILEESMQKQAEAAERRRKAIEEERKKRAEKDAAEAGVQALLRAKRAFQALTGYAGSDPDKAKSAYRQAAMRHHPDRGGDSKTFAALAEAWELLQKAI